MRRKIWRSPKNAQKPIGKSPLGGAGRARLADPATREAEAVRIGDWAKEMCLLFGSSLDTAFVVGGTLAQGLLESWEEKDVEAV